MIERRNAPNLKGKVKNQNSNPQKFPPAAGKCAKKKCAKTYFFRQK